MVGLDPMSYLAQITAAMPDVLLLVPLTEFSHERPLSLWAAPEGDEGVPRVASVAVRTHGRSWGIGPPAVKADGFTGNALAH